MTRLRLASLVVVALILVGPLLATLALYLDRTSDQRQTMTDSLVLALLFGWEALLGLVLFLLKVVSNNARSQDLIQRLSNAVQQTADAVLITDQSGTIEYVNPAFERISGYSRDEVIGRNPRILKSGQHLAEYYETLWRTVLSGAPFHGSPINRRKNGTLFYADQTITPMRAGAGEITHFVSVMRDMTDRRLIEEQEIEMRLAASIQRKLLPQRPPRADGYEVAGAVMPALATCGDYFDFITMRNEVLCLAVADASGHGVGPALIAVQTRAHLRSLVQADLKLDQILREVNEILASDLEDGLFVTMAIVCLEPATGALVWANAGHPTSYVFDAAGAVKAELRSTGLPLGMLPGRPYTLGQGITCEPGEVVLILTDGILEAEDGEGTEFGATRALEVVQANVQRSAEEIVERLLGAVSAFTGGRPQQDDLTVVVCRRTPLGLKVR